MTDTASAVRGYTLTRHFDAPPEAVWRAWTDPTKLGWFFNPEQPIPDEIEVDLRVGGQWRQLMRIDEDTDYVTGGIYRELVPGRRLVFAFGAVGGWPALDPERLDDALTATVELSPAESGTLMVFRFEAPAHLSDDEVRELLVPPMLDGWIMTLDRLVA